MVCKITNFRPPPPPAPELRILQAVEESCSITEDEVEKFQLVKPDSDKSKSVVQVRKIGIKRSNNGSQSEI